MKLLSQLYKNVRDTRIQFATKECKNIWENKIRIAKRFFKELEGIETVAHDLRRCAIVDVPIQEVDSFTRRIAKKGLILVPITKIGMVQSFTHLTPVYHDEYDFLVKCVVTKNTADAEELIDAFMTSNNETIGRLLGFPPCCVDFFNQIWSDGYFDPIWQQGENTVEKKVFDFQDEVHHIDRHVIKIKPGNHEIISVFRYLGIRVVSHLPCSFSCTASIDIANERMKLAKEIQMAGLDETLDILSLPFEWDCLKGIAIINTPVFKMVTDSVPCFPRYIIRKDSDFYPEEAPSGLQFPWKNPLFR